MSFTRRWGPALAWGLGIAVLTSIPNPHGWPAFEHADKLVHFFLYGVFGYLLARPLLSSANPSLPNLLLAATVCVVIGGLDEWHQRWIPGRNPDVADWAADVAGAFTGIAIAAVTFTRRRRRGPR